MNIENVLLSNRVDGRALNNSTEDAFCPSISQYIDLLTVFKIFILFLLLVSSLSWNEFCLFWIQRFLFELLNDLPVEQKYSASNTEVFPEPLEPKEKLFKSENSKSRLLKQRKHEIDIFFIVTFYIKSGINIHLKFGSSGDVTRQFSSGPKRWKKHSSDSMVEKISWR